MENGLWQTILQSSNKDPMLFQTMCNMAKNFQKSVWVKVYCKNIDRAGKRMCKSIIQSMNFNLSVISCYTAWHIEIEIDLSFCCNSKSKQRTPCLSQGRYNQKVSFSYFLNSIILADIAGKCNCNRNDSRSYMSHGL